MARLNTASKHRADAPRTHEGAVADRLTPADQLRRTIATCLLWEKTFYEDGQSIADRIGHLVEQCTVHECAEIAVEAREKMNIRHAPLLVCAHMARVHGGNAVVGQTIARVIQRADELTELPAIVAEINGVSPANVSKVLSAQMKRGLALAFTKFDAYQLAKYNRNGAIKLRDVLFMVHAKPLHDEQAATWKQLVEGTLPTPDTWETRLSAGEDKSGSFEALLREGKLGYMALLRNLRNMEQAGVNRDLVTDAIRARKGAKRVMPIRFLSAYHAAPSFADALSEAMLAVVNDLPELGGNTAVIVDVSGSMSHRVSEKSMLARWEVAASLAALVPGNIRTFVFGTTCTEVGSFKGIPGVNEVGKALWQNRNGWVENRNGLMPVGHGTNMGNALRYVQEVAPETDRIIVVSDMQTSDSLPPLDGAKGYAINVAPYQNAVAFHHGWTHISGWSDNVIRYIREVEEEVD